MPPKKAKAPKTKALTKKPAKGAPRTGKKGAKPPKADKTKTKNAKRKVAKKKRETKRKQKKRKEKKRATKAKKKAKKIQKKARKANKKQKKKEAEKKQNSEGEEADDDDDDDNANSEGQIAPMLKNRFRISGLSLFEMQGLRATLKLMTKKELIEKLKQTLEGRSDGDKEMFMGTPEMRMKLFRDQEKPTDASAGPFQSNRFGAVFLLPGE